MMPVINIRPFASESEAEDFRLTLKDAEKFGLYCCHDGENSLWSVIPKIALDFIFNAETGLPVTKRTWVGLTDEELFDCWESAMNGNVYTKIRVYSAIEAKLKEKNNG